jgi:zinc and cadmium transporter
MPLLQVVLFSALGGIFSLGGGALLLWKGKIFAGKFEQYILSFAVGVLLSAALLDLLPEALELVEEPHGVLAWTLAGMLVFFVLERYLSWFHHHHSPHGHQPTVILLSIGDTLHNFIDGIAIGTAFLVSPQLGIVTSLAVALHEIPQEMGDAAIMLSSGLRRTSILLLNGLSSFASVVGAVVIYLLGNSVQFNFSPVIAFTAGMFLYIAASDLLPTLHSKSTKNAVFIQTSMLFLGVFVVYLLVKFTHGE